MAANVLRTVMGHNGTCDVLSRKLFRDRRLLLVAHVEVSLAPRHTREAPSFDVPRSNTPTPLAPPPPPLAHDSTEYEYENLISVLGNFVRSRAHERMEIDYEYAMELERSIESTKRQIKLLDMRSYNPGLVCAYLGRRGLLPHQQRTQEANPAAVGVNIWEERNVKSEARDEREVEERRKRVMAARSSSLVKDETSSRR